MKKLLSLLAAVGLTATSTTTVIACDTGDTDGNPNAGETFAIGEISNIYSETILKAAESKISNFKASDYEVYSYDQTSAKLIQKKSVSSSATFNPVTVTYTIKALDFRDENIELRTNILVGNMDENGVIDQTTKLADIMSKKLITDDSIRTSFAQMNGTFLNEGDIEIGDVDYEAKTVEIVSKNQNVLKGESVILMLNTEINSADLLRDLNIGTIYLPTSLYDKKETYFGGEKIEASNLLASYPLMFQNLGDRNKLFSYLAADLANSALAIIPVAMDDTAGNVSETSMKINLAWESAIMGGKNELTSSSIINKDSQTVEVKFNLAKDERLVVGDYIPDNAWEISDTVYSSNDPEKVKKALYKVLDSSIKSKVSEEIFIKYSTIHFLGKDGESTIEFLPGGDWIYALNSQAFTLLKMTGSLSEEEIAALTPPQSDAGIPGYSFVVGG